MNRYLFLLTPLIIISCSGVKNYEPIIGPVSSRYKSDLQECKDTAMNNPPDCATAQLAGSLGLVGYLAYNATTADANPCNMSKYELVDVCLKQKGYKI